MNRAIFVFGPESSGTRLLTRCFLASNCSGTDTHDQPFDVTAFGKVVGVTFPKADGNIVLRRSFPHGDIWPNIPEMVNVAVGAGYDPVIFVTIRDWIPMVSSAARDRCRGVVPYAGTRARMALELIFQGLSKVKIPYYVVTYESLVKRPNEVMKWAWGVSGLDMSKLTFKITDENWKYYA